MNKFAIAVLLAVLATALAGCDEENKEPYITVLKTSGDCGVAPFLVEFYAAASGGDELDDPTGANLRLDIRWDFGDETGATGSSLVFHSYPHPGEYLARVTVEDKDGDSATATRLITVQPDTLNIWTTAEPGPGPIAAGVPVQLNVFAESCEFDPDEGNYGRYLFRWRVDTTPAVVYTGRSPVHSFTAAQPGTRIVTVSVEDPRLAVVRRDTLVYEVQGP